MSSLRPPVVAGLALVVLGALLLLRNLGLLAEVPVGPVLVIAVGVMLVVAALREQPEAAGSTGPARGTPVAVAADGVTRARIVLDHGAGTLNVASGGAPGMVLEGRADGVAGPQLRREGDLLEVRLRPTGGTEPGGWLSRGEALTWDLALGTDIRLELELRTGASRVRVDLSDVPVELLRLRTGASDVDLTLPARGHCSASISAGAAEIRVRVPYGVAAAVRNRTALASFTIDEARFPRSGDGFRSVDYEVAEARVDVHVEGGVASFDVR